MIVEHPKSTIVDAHGINMKELEDHFSKPQFVEDMHRKVDMGLREWEESVVMKYLPAGCSVLDIGCGGGREAIQLARRGYRVVAVDLSRPQLDRARENAKKKGVEIKFLKTDGLNLPDEKFDAILLWAQLLGGIESECDRITLLRNCRDSLTDKGVVSVSGHNKVMCQEESPEYTDDRWLYPWGKGELKYRLFTADTFKALLTESDFDILDVEIPDSLPVVMHAVGRGPN